MSIEYKLFATQRDQKGTSSSARMRRQNLVPAIIYGAGKPQQLIQFDVKSLNVIHSHPEFYSHVIELDVDGKKESVVLKDWQQFPVKNGFLHLDFLRIETNKKIHMNVPIHFVGEDKSPGIKDMKGIPAHIITEVMIACLPKHLPEYIIVDVSHLGLGESIHLSDIQWPPHVELYHQDLTQDDKAVFSINSPQKEIEETSETSGSQVESEEDGAVIDDSKNVDSKESDLG